jgi:hypothetical protein
MKNYTKALLAALLIGAAPVTVAATLPTFDVSNTIDVSIGGGAVNYSGNIVSDGVDYKLINILGSQGTPANYTTTYNTDSESIALYNWDNSAPDALGSLVATGTINWADPVSGAIQFALSAFLTAGSYVLAITGANNTSYAGTISAVPLPGAALLFGSALLGAGVVGRKKLGSKRSEAVAA